MWSDSPVISHHIFVLTDFLLYALYPLNHTNTSHAQACLLRFEHKKMCVYQRLLLLQANKCLGCSPWVNIIGCHYGNRIVWLLDLNLGPCSSTYIITATLIKITQLYCVLTGRLQHVLACWLASTLKSLWYITNGRWQTLFHTELLLRILSHTTYYVLIQGAVLYRLLLEGVEEVEQLTAPQNSIWVGMQNSLCRQRTLGKL